MTDQGPSPAGTTPTVSSCVRGAAQRHYEVISPEMTHYEYMGPPELFRCWGVYLAKNAKDAIRQAVADPEFREWVVEQRASREPPFKGLKAFRTLCDHGVCWGCVPDLDETSNCPECREQWAAEDEQALTAALYLEETTDA